MINISFSVDSFFVIEYFFYEKPQHLLSSDWNLEKQQKENVLPFILFSIFIVERHKCSFFMIVYILEITELLWKKKHTCRCFCAADDYLYKSNTKMYDKA